MIRSGDGGILYMASVAAVQTVAGGSSYAAFRAGLNMLANVAHQELADCGIRTVALAPGLTVTRGMRAIVTDEHIARVAANYPGGRIGEPDDLVAWAVSLCGDAANHLSGTVTMVRPPVTR